MSDDRAIQPDPSRSISLPGQPSRLARRGLQHLDRPRRRLIDLGTLGGSWSHAADINAQGQIVGTAETADECSHAFLWEDGRMYDLGTLGGSISSSVAVNSRGQVVGTSLDRAGAELLVIWSDGEVSDLGVLDWIDSIINSSGPYRNCDVPFDPDLLRVRMLVHDINDSGEVIGSILTYYLDSKTDIFKLHLEFGFLWNSGDFEILEPCPSIIDNFGRVYGGASPSRETTDFGQKLKELLNFDGHSSHQRVNAGRMSGVIAANDLGQTVEWGYDHSQLRTVFWDGELGSIIPSLSDSTEHSTPTDVNNKGIVVGWSGWPELGLSSKDVCTSEWLRPFVYEHGKVSSLSRLVHDWADFKCPLVTFGVGEKLVLKINDTGQIVGTLETQDGLNRAFLCE